MKRGKIYIYGPIGGANGVSAEWITRSVEFLNSDDVDSFVVYINSPGGSYFEAIAIYNLLKGLSDVEVKITGTAASAAALIAMAGSRIGIADNSFLMIHNVMMEPEKGNYDVEHYQQLANDLKKIGSSMIGIFSEKTGKSEKEIKKILNKGDFLTAQESVNLGFCDEIISVEEINREVMNYVLQSPDNFNTKKEIKMDPIGLRKQLDLSVTATDEEVNAKITELKEKAEAEAMLRQAQQQEDKTVEARIKAIEDSFEESKKLSFKSNVEAMVDNAVNDFKILPADKEIYVNAALKDFEKTKERLDAIPKDAMKPGRIELPGDSDKSVGKDLLASNYFKAQGRYPIGSKA